MAERPGWWEATRSGGPRQPEPAARRGGGPSWWTGQPEPGDAEASGPRPAGSGGSGAVGVGAARSLGAEGMGGGIISKVFGGIGRAVAGVPRAVYEGTKGLASDALLATKSTLMEVAGYDETPWDRKWDEAASQGAGFLEALQHTAPTTGAMAASVQRTGGRLAHPTRIARDYGNDPVGTFLEDASNLALFLGPAAKAAGAAAAGAEATAATSRLAAGVGKAARATQTAANLPVKPFELAARGTAAGASRLYRAASAGDGVVGDLLRTTRLDPDSRLIRREALTPAMEAQSEAVGRQVKLGQQVAAALDGPVEEQAMFLVGERQADALAKARSAMPAEEFDRFVEETFRGSVGRDAAHLAADVADGAAPEAAARIEDALRIGRDGPGGRAERSESFLAGRPGREWQQGYEPNPQAIDDAAESVMRGIPRAERLARTLRQRADRAVEDYNAAVEGAAPLPVDRVRRLAGWTEDAVGRADRAMDGGLASTLDRRAAVSGAEGRLEAGLARVAARGEGLGRLEQRAAQSQQMAARAEQVLGRMRQRVSQAAGEAASSVDAAPARLRPALEVNRRAADAVLAHARALRAEGLGDAAELLERSAAELPRTLSELKAAGVDPDHFIHVSIGDRPSAAGAVEGRLPKVRKARSERFREDGLVFDRSVRAQVQGEIDEVRAATARQAADRIAAMPFTARLGQGALDGVTSAEAAERLGYVPWNPATVFEKGRVGKAEEAAAAAGGTGTTAYVPKHVFEGFRSYFNDPQVERLLRKAYDQPVQAWKATVLALNPSWNVGNVIGNVVLATLGAGVDPVTLAAEIGRVVRERRRTGEFPAPRRLLTAGPTYEEMRFLRPPDEEILGGTRARRAALAATAPVRAVARGAYALNQFIDDVGRSAVYLAKKSKGMSDEAAVREALKAMGDFSRMTPFERRVVRRVIPFYAWQRHITQLAFRLPLEHPMRVAWTLHLADLYGRPDEDLAGVPGFLKGAVPVGDDKLLDAGRFWPFGDAGRVLTPDGLLRSTSPVIKLAAANGLGLNLNRPSLQFTRPPGTGEHDAYGRPVSTAPSVLKQLGDLVPQKRLADALAGRDQVVRYDTGEPILTRRGPIDTGRSPGQGVLRFLGIPLADRAEAVEMAERVAAKREAEEKARLKYEKRAARASR